MENTQIEVKAVEEVVREVDAQLKELGDLQLAFVGGGIGNTII
jgi:hypothetical protein